MYLDMCAIKVVRNAVLEHGTVCPSATIQDCCGQYKCPINCLTSEWSGWAKCTAECEGSLESHTRNILMTPMHGGESCNTVEESRACNTMSCDRDCFLQRLPHVRVIWLCACIRVHVI